MPIGTEAPHVRALDLGDVALLLLHESLTLVQIAGGCIILVGGFLVI